MQVKEVSVKKIQDSIDFLSIKIESSEFPNSLFKSWLEKNELQQAMYMMAGFNIEQGKFNQLQIVDRHWVEYWFFCDYQQIIYRLLYNLQTRDYIVINPNYPYTTIRVLDSNGRMKLRLLEEHEPIMFSSDGIHIDSVINRRINTRSCFRWYSATVYLYAIGEEPISIVAPYVRVCPDSIQYSQLIRMYTTAIESEGVKNRNSIDDKFCFP